MTQNKMPRANLSVQDHWDNAQEIPASLPHPHSSPEKALAQKRESRAGQCHLCLEAGHADDAVLPLSGVLAVTAPSLVPQCTLLRALSQSTPHCGLCVLTSQMGSSLFCHNLEPPGGSKGKKQKG